MIGFTNIHVYVDKKLVRLWLVLLVFAVGSLIDVAEFTVKSGESTGFVRAAFALCGLFCVAVLKATALTALFAVCHRNGWLKAVSVALIVLFMLLSLINGGCWLFYGFGFSMKLFTIIAETNPAEIGEFLPELGAKLMALAASPLLWIAIVCMSAAWIWLPRIQGNWLAMGGLVLSGLGVLYFVVEVLPAEFGRINHSVFARSSRCMAKYVADRRKIHELEVLKRPIPSLESLTSRYASEKVVVVIGESASRQHLSLYGYRLQTTPMLDSIRNDLYIFDDAVASSTSTAENIPRLLSFMTDEPGNKDWYEYPTMIQIFRRLGYRTYWLSNQEHTGRWLNISSIISGDADVQRYVGNFDSEDHYLYRYDDALLPAWNDVLNTEDTLQLTFFHLMGSHFQYDRRFPSSRRHFSGKDVASKMPRKWLNAKKAEVVANYDNSILFTDSVLSVLIKGVRAMEQPAVLIYLSDHGENVYDTRDYRGRDIEFVEVPFLIYANEAYKQRNPEIIRGIEASRANPFSTSELPQILLHITGTSYAMYDSVRDPLSVAFRKRKRWVDENEFQRDAIPDLSEYECQGEGNRKIRFAN